MAAAIPAKPATKLSQRFAQRLAQRLALGEQMVSEPLQLADLFG
jgi:hypothetical protein